ncbi:MAG: cell division protein FtsL [Tissierellia bacterium]|nr:cell division protein FtsL [Tissierellia bacterium]
MTALRKEAYEFYEEPQEYSPKKKRIKSKNRNKMVIQGFKNTAMVATAFLLGILIIYNYALITDKKMELQNISSDIEQLHNEINEYNVALESIKNTNKIEEVAKNYLGMNYPTRKQTVFIDFAYGETEDESNVLAYDNQNQLYALIDKVIGFIQ